jgi:hypothetical protein
MQLALTNVGQTTFGQAKDEEMVRETVDEDDAFSEKQHQNRKAFTAKDAEDTEEGNGLPRMDADERGLENPKPIVWNPTPDMYRTDTPEGREAYEASFRMTIASPLGAERKPPQPVITPEHRAETHAVLGCGGRPG